jgi:ATP-binding cassette, subfamily B (MDR/TAP), member 1
MSDPRILLLDEATSARDTQLEGIVQDALDMAAAGKRLLSSFRLRIILITYLIRTHDDHYLSRTPTASLSWVMVWCLSKALTVNCCAMKMGPMLLTAQKLCDQCEAEVRDSDSDTISANGKETVKKAKDDVYIGRRNSVPSLASDIIVWKRQASDAHKDNYSLTYLFMRMGNSCPQISPSELGTQVQTMDAQCEHNCPHDTQPSLTSSFCKTAEFV